MLETISAPSQIPCNSTKLSANSEDHVGPPCIHSNGIENQDGFQKGEQTVAAHDLVAEYNPGGVLNVVYLLSKTLLEVTSQRSCQAVHHKVPGILRKLWL